MSCIIFIFSSTRAHKRTGLDRPQRIQRIGARVARVAFQMLQLHDCEHIVQHCATRVRGQGVFDLWKEKGDTVKEEME
jgi:hypothetical protein